MCGRSGSPSAGWLAGWLADLRCARDVRYGIAQRGSRVRQHVIGYAPFSWRQAVQRPFNRAQDRQALVGVQATQLRRQDGRRDREGGVFGGADVGGKGFDAVAGAALVFNAAAEGRTVKVRTQPRHDAAADVDAALAPKVTARLAAAVPGMAQKASSVSVNTGSLPSSARRVISGADSGVGVRP